jgi:hypothetical protein
MAERWHIKACQCYPRYLTVLETLRIEGLYHKADRNARLGSLTGISTLKSLRVDTDLLLPSQNIFTSVFDLIPPGLRSLQLSNIHWVHLDQLQSYNTRQVMKNIARETSLTNIELRHLCTRPLEYRILSKKTKLAADMQEAVDELSLAGLNMKIFFGNHDGFYGDDWLFVAPGMEIVYRR